MKRGIVLSPDFRILPNGQAFFEAATDQDELRKYLLYWDKIDVPLTTMVLFECSDFDFLYEAGVLTRTPYSSTNQRLMRIRDSYKMTLPSEAGIEILLGHEHVYREKCASEPGAWSRGQLSTELVSLGQSKRDVVEIELSKVLPVPIVDTPLNEILEFKESHIDELESFRFHLDDVYQKILASADINRSLSTEVRRLEKSLENVNRVLKESRIGTALRSLKTVISSTDGIIGVAVGVGSTQFIPFSPLVSGVSAAGVSVAAKMLMYSENSLPNEFVYLKSMHEQLGRIA